MHECYTRGYWRDEIPLVGFAHDVIYGCIQRTAVAGTEASYSQSFWIPEWSSIHLYGKIHTSSYNSLCSPTIEYNTDQSPVSRSIAYCEYVRPIFQSQLLNVSPDKSNDTRFSYNQDDFGSRISKIAFVKL